MYGLYYSNCADFTSKLSYGGGCVLLNTPFEEENGRRQGPKGRRMSLPVAALACELDKNLKTFGSSLDVLFERSSGLSSLARVAAFLPMEGYAPICEIGFSLADRTDSVMSARGHCKKVDVGMNISFALQVPRYSHPRAASCGRFLRRNISATTRLPSTKVSF